MWSSTHRFPRKRILFPVGSSFLKTCRRTYQNGGTWRRQRTLLSNQYSMGQTHAWLPSFCHRIFISNSSLSSSTVVTVDKEVNDVHEPKVVASRRRRPLRMSSVPNRNIGEQRLYSSPGVEQRYELQWNSNVKKFRTFVLDKFPSTNGQATRRISPKDYPTNLSLRDWLRRVREEYRKKLRGQPNRLTERRLQQLRELGFQFIDTTHKSDWNTVFEQLCTYLKKHDGRYPQETDHSLLCEEGRKLHVWCIRQRVMYKLYTSQQDDKCYMNEERIRALNSINFVWNVKESQWDEKYEELKKYYKAHGTTLVPSVYISNYSLGRWVGTQRRQYSLRQKDKPSHLTDERIQLLNKLNFIWDPFEAQWMERYHELIEYQRLNGQNEMPTNASNPSLRRWLLLQRKQYHEWMNGEPSKMTARRKELLDQLGMDWLPAPKKKKSSGK